MGGPPPLTVVACLCVGAAPGAVVSISQSEARVRKFDAINFSVDEIGLMYATVHRSRRSIAGSAISGTCVSALERCRSLRVLRLIYVSR